MGVGVGGGSEIFGALFSKKCPFVYKKVPFLANIECCPKFLKYALVCKRLQSEYSCVQKLQD